MFQQHLAIFHKSRPSAGVVPTPMALMVPTPMVSTEFIKNWGGQNGGIENNLGGAFAPPPLPPPGAATGANPGLMFNPLF